MGQPSSQPGRLAREKRTVQAMIAIYCEAHHDGRHDLCAECVELRDYALARLDHCPFGETKTTCATCPIHCYRPVMRGRIRLVMRYSGPRMLCRHPIQALRHHLDSWRGGRNVPGKEADNAAKDR